MFKANICVRPWDLVLTVSLKTICPHAAGLMTPMGSYLRTSYIIISHNISFNSCYQSRPCKYRLLKSIRHRLIYHYSFVLSWFSRVLTVSGWPHSILDWPCASLSLVSNCVPVHESSLLIARLALIVSVYRCSSCLSFVAFFCFVLFSVLYSLFLCFSLFLTKIRKSKRRKSCTGCQLTHPSFKTE